MGKRKDRKFEVWSNKQGKWLKFEAKTAKHAIALYLKAHFPNQQVKSLMVCVSERARRSSLAYVVNDGKITYLYRDNEIEESPESFKPKSSGFKVDDDGYLMLGATEKIMALGHKTLRRPGVEKLRDFCNDTLLYWDKLKEAGQ